MAFCARTCARACLRVCVCACVRAVCLRVWCRAVNPTKTKLYINEPLKDNFNTFWGFIIISRKLTEHTLLHIRVLSPHWFQLVKFGDAIFYIIDVRLELVNFCADRLSDNFLNRSATVANKNHNRLSCWRVELAVLLKIWELYWRRRQHQQQQKMKIVVFYITSCVWLFVSFSVHVIPGFRWLQFRLVRTCHLLWRLGQGLSHVEKGN